MEHQKVLSLLNEANEICNKKKEYCQWKFKKFGEVSLSIMVKEMELPIIHKL